MVSLIRLVWPLLIGIGILMIGHGMQAAFIGYRASIEGFSAQTAGIIMSGYFIGMLSGAFFSTRLVRKVGHIRVFSAFASIASGIILLYIFTNNPIIWFLIRLFTGFAFTSLYVVSESWLNNAATNQTRGGLLSIYLFIQYIALSAGSYSTGFFQSEANTLFLVSSLAVSLALVPVALLAVKKDSYLPDIPRLTIKECYKISPLATIGIGLSGALMSVYFAVGSVFAATVGLSGRENALMLALYSLGGLTAQYPLGRLSDKIDRRYTVIFGVALLFIGTTLSLAFIDNRYPLFFIGTFINGAAILPLYALLVAHGNDFVKSEQMVAFSSTMYQIYAVTAFASAFALGFILQQWQEWGFYGYIYIGGTIMITVTCYRMAIRSVLRKKPSQTFTMPPRATPVAAMLQTDAEVHPKMQKIFKSNE